MFDGCNEKVIILPNKNEKVMLQLSAINPSDELQMLANIANVIAFCFILSSQLTQDLLRDKQVLSLVL